MVDSNNNDGNLVCVPLQPPRILQETSVFDKTVQVLKGMVESHVSCVDGTKFTIEIPAEKHIVNGDGVLVFNTIRHEPPNMVMTFVEKFSGNDVGENNLETMQKLVRDWMTHKFDEVEDVLPKELVEHKYHMSCLFFETDPSYREVKDAWVGEGIVPEAYTIGYGKEETEESLNLSVEWKGVYTSSNATRLFAQKILDDFNKEQE